MTIVLIICLVVLCALSLVSDIIQRKHMQKIQERLILTNAELFLSRDATGRLRIVNKNLREEATRLKNENTELRQSLIAALTAPVAAKTQQNEEERCESAAPSLLPSGISTNMYCCEPYDKFVVNSEQAMLQEDCFTDPQTGIRYYLLDGKKYLCAAMATAYGTEIGRTYSVHLKNGYDFNVIVADFKHDISAPRADDYGDITENYDGESAMCIIEFVVDMAFLPRAVKDAGTMSALEQFGGLYGEGGDILTINDTGRKWKP